MKLLQSSLPFCLFLFFFSCADDNEPMDVIVPSVDSVDLGRYYLTPDTKHSFVYYRSEGYANSKIQFVDNMGNLLELHIMGNTDLEEAFTQESVVAYNVSQPGDEIHYNYEYEFESYILKVEDQARFPFYISIRAFPSVPGLDSVVVADVLTISSFEDNQSTPTGTLITKILDKRTWPEAPTNDLLIGDFTLFNKTFTKVYKREMSTDWQLYFNLEVGIISFTDENGTKWRFEKFIN